MGKKKKKDYDFYLIDDSEFFDWQDQLSEEARKEWIEYWGQEEYDRQVAEHEKKEREQQLPESQMRMTTMIDLMIEKDANWHIYKNGRIYPSDKAPAEAIKDFNKYQPYNLIPGYLHTEKIPEGFEIDLVTVDDFYEMRRRIGYTTEQINQELPLIFNEKEISERENRVNKEKSEN